MKKLYLILLLLNNIAAIILISTFSSNLILSILAAIVLIALTITIIKRKKLIETIDYITLSTYMLYVISLFIFSIIFQTSNPETFNMMYYSKCLILPNIIFNLFNLLK